MRTVELPPPTARLWNRVLRALRLPASASTEAVAVGKFEGVTRTGISEPMLAVSQVGAPDIVVTSTLWNLSLVPRAASWWTMAVFC